LEAQLPFLFLLGQVEAKPHRNVPRQSRENSGRTFGVSSKTQNRKTTPLWAWLLHAGPAGLDAGGLSRSSIA
jgi:hypothetical protein